MFFLLTAAEKLLTWN